MSELSVKIIFLLLLLVVVGFVFLLFMRGKKGFLGVALPIVGGRVYNISLFGLEKCHKFDSKKYGKVQQYLEKHVGLCKTDFTKASLVTQQELLSVHTPDYLKSLCYSETIAKIVELNLVKWVPNIILRWRLLKPMKLATGGTVQAAKLALQYGWAINLGGGYHHAKHDAGDGFCVYADIPIAVEQLWKENSNLHVMVIDLDAHQGSGYQNYFADDKRVTMFDIYNDDRCPPRWKKERQYIRFNFPVHDGTGADAYITLLTTELPNALDILEKEGNRPDLIIFNAGTDSLVSDPLGRMDITPKAMIVRDEFVFEQAKTRKIPIVYLFSGGYSQESAHVIGASLANILERFLGIEKGGIFDKVPVLFEK